MITIIQGTLGGGKTCRAVRAILEHLRKGLYVYTNVDFVFSEMRHFIAGKWSVEAQRKQIIALPAMEQVKDWVDFIEWGTPDAPVLVVIDEAQCFWNSRDWAETQKHQKNMLSFLSQSRKADVDIIFISQSAGNVDKQFRELAEIIINCRNMAKVKIPILKLPLFGIFRYQTIEISHSSAIRDLIIDAEWWPAWGRNRSVFKCYRTRAFLDGFMNELASTKQRLRKVELRRTPSLRPLAQSLYNGDPLEKIVGKVLRLGIAAKLKRDRSRTRGLPLDHAA